MFQDVGMWFEDHKVDCVIQYWGDIDGWDPCCSDCEWFVPGTIVED